MRGVIAKTKLGLLVDLLSATHEVLAPVKIQDAIQFAPIRRIQEMAFGYVERREAGRYRLERATEPRLFTFLNAAESVKRWLHPPRQVMFTVHTKEGRAVIEDQDRTPRPLAFFGLRSCDLHGIRILDWVFLHETVDPYYRRRRADSLIVVVNCTHPGATCFCASMGAGPRADAGYDLALTELPDRFTVHAATPAGRNLLERLSPRKIESPDRVLEDEMIAGAVRTMGRTVNTADLPQVIERNLDHPHWQELHHQCLGCANCAMVCPTCFCYGIEDVPNINAGTVERVRTWDTCLSKDFAGVHGGNFRPDRRSRFRQFAAHKLSYWVPQFGSFGCVGCGRCVAWCPVSIDITAVAATVRAGSK